MKKALYTLPVRLLCLLVALGALLLTLWHATGSRMLLKTSMLDPARSGEIVAALDKGPHPRGSVAHEEVRSALSGLLSKAGVTPVEMTYPITYEDTVRYVETGVLVPESELTNLLVEIPGEVSDVLLVVAHTDSVPMGPGVSDDLAAVANMVQCIEQLAKGNASYRNTVVFLFTDGEEEGMLGAACFAQSRKPTAVRIGGAPATQAQAESYQGLIERVRFVINLESRGTGGQTLLFETTRGNARTASLFAAHNPGLFASSLAADIYRLMDNNTDFTVFSQRGIQGLNVANIGEAYYYHTQSDDLAHLKDTTLQRSGDALMASLEAFGNAPLAELSETQDDAIFFDYLGGFTFSLPRWAAWVGAGLSVLLLLLWAGRARARLGGSTVLRHVVLGLVVLLAGLLAGVLTALGLTRALGGDARFATRLASPLYMSLWLYLGLAATGLTGAFLVWGGLSKLLALPGRCIREAASLLLCLLGGICAFVLPAASYLFLPAGLLGLVLMILTTLRVDAEPPPLGLYALVFAVLFPLAGGLSIIAAEALGGPLLYLLILPTLLSFALVLPYALDIPVRRRVLSWLCGILLLALCAASLLGIEWTGSAARDLTANLGLQETAFLPAQDDDALTYVRDMDVQGGILVVRDSDVVRQLGSQLFAAGFAPEQEGWKALADPGVYLAKPTVHSRFDNVLMEMVVSVERAYEQSEWRVYFPAGGVTRVTFTDTEGRESVISLPASSISGPLERVFAADRDGTLRLRVGAKIESMVYVENLPAGDLLAEEPLVRQVLALDRRLLPRVEIQETLVAP